jgi:DNA-binding response OmpR family regulator
VGRPVILVALRKGPLRRRLVELLDTSPEEYAVVCADRRAPLRARLQRTAPALLILGSRTQDSVDAVRTCLRVRQHHDRGSLGVLVIAQKLDPNREMQVLRAGADLCIPAKLLERDVLLHGIRGLLARVTEGNGSTLSEAGLEIVREERVLIVVGRTYQFADAQFDVLRRLAQEPGRFLSPCLALGIDPPPRMREARQRARLMARVRISRLRKRLGSDRELIKTRRGLGYGLNPSWRSLN